MRALMDRIPRLNPEVGAQRVGGRLMVAGPGDHLHTFEDEVGAVSEVGERIVELCDGKRTVAQIVETLCAEFEVEPAECASDTAAFVQDLVEKRVLELG